MKGHGTKLSGGSMISKFKHALSKYPTGIACVFTKSLKNDYKAIIINSLSSVSIKPLLVLWSLDINSRNFTSFKKSKEQIIVLLSKKQKKIVEDIAYKKNDVSSLELNKIVKKSIFSLTCNKHKVIKAGDHFTIFLKVKKILINSGSKPLLYYQKKIHSF